MMQPILDYRAEAVLKDFQALLSEATDDQVLSIAEIVFGIDVEEPFEDEHGKSVPFDRDDAETMIEGRLLDAFTLAGLAKSSYVDYEWAKAEGLTW